MGRTTTLDSKLRALQPTAKRIESAAEIGQNTGEIPALVGWVATFRRDQLECTGVWPDEDTAGHLDEIEVLVGRTCTDHVDPERSHHRERERCRLAIRQAIERHELETRMMSEALTSQDAS